MDKRPLSKTKAADELAAIHAALRRAGPLLVRRCGKQLVVATLDILADGTGLLCLVKYFEIQLLMCF
jgi:hypothetical protein